MNNLIPSFNDTLQRIFQCLDPTPTRIAIATSGGIDSSALLSLVHHYVQTHPHENIALSAFHIHHGLSPHADAWENHTRLTCDAWKIPFATVRVSIDRRQKIGIEATARLARYAALGQCCKEHHVSLLLTAHHQNDQAETLLFHLLRGTGVAGLAGMPEICRAPDLLRDATVWLARPLLACSRQDLEAYVKSQGLCPVHDESNDDTRYTRNALRHHVIPALTQHFPSAVSQLARCAQQMQSTKELLTILAENDAGQALTTTCLHLSAFKPPLQAAARINNILRAWLAANGVRLPSKAWCEDLREQILFARKDAQVCVAYTQGVIRRYRDQIFLLRQTTTASANPAPVIFRWQGEAARDFPTYGGTLYFDPAPQGLSATWLGEKSLMLHQRRGGESIQLSLNRPARSLKDHYQALGIPPWERAMLPLISAEGRILFAAGIGMDCRHESPRICDGAGNARVFRWCSHTF